MKRIIATIVFVAGFSVAAQAGCIGNSPIGCGVNGPWDYQPQAPQMQPIYTPPPMPQTWTGMNMGGGNTSWQSNNGQHFTCMNMGGGNVRCQ